MQPSSNSSPQLWGGVECTVNRVGNTYFDQMERSGHASRIEDLDLFADLGLSALRYPILWERIAPRGVASANWSWADARLHRLRDLRIEPIVGLVHHGSGPSHTSLTDPTFPEQLAEYARAVAQRYPWVCYYTPVNEPLTTARFSGLYGHWYPHGHDGLTWARTLLTQCRAVVLSMQAVREINSNAQLVQTEDLGKTYSTRHMSYQADFDNERRWLSFDLLCGRVQDGHPMADYLRWLGVPDAEWKWFADAPCCPDIFGCNYYVTGERFLDERLERYPPDFWGNNGQDSYADVEAVRVCAEGIAGFEGLLREIWGRYQRPIAITEAHLGCTCEEQMRWLQEAWRDVNTLRHEGVDVRAMTVWALLGSYDWDSLVTRSQGHYEPGAFEMRDGTPCPTPLAAMLKDLSAHGVHDSRVFESTGWWRRPERLLYPAVSRSRLQGQAEVGTPQVTDASGHAAAVTKPPLLIR